MAQKVNQSQIMNGATLISTVTATAGESFNPYPVGAWNNVGGMSALITTTKPNQLIGVISRFQAYQGGYVGARYLLDGSVVGNEAKHNMGALGNTTTAANVHLDWFPVATPGDHTIQLQVNPGSANLRIINAEGNGKMLVISG